MSVLHSFVTPGSPNLDAIAAGYELGVGRAVPTAAAVLGFVAVVAGGVARSRRTGQAWLVLALTLGPASVAVGVLHGANAAGGPGTGNGVVGAVFAVVLGAVGTVLAASALVRFRRTARSGERSTS